MTYTYRIVHVAPFQTSIYVMQSDKEFHDFIAEYCKENFLHIVCVHTLNMALAYNADEKVMIVQE